MVSQYSIGIVECVVALVVWGAWPFAAAKCDADTPIFFMLYVIGGLLFAIFMCLVTSQFSSTAVYEPAQIVYVVVGGMCCAHGDFVVVCAFKRIPSYIAFPLYTGSH